MKKCLGFLLVLLALACNEEETVPQGGGEEVVSKGSSYEVLLKEGNCSLFLEAVEKAGYADLLKGKGLSTVMVPDDSVFSAYLAQKNYSSIDAIEPEVLGEMVGLHFLMFSLNKEQMLNFQARAEQPTLPGLSYKHRTYFAKGIETIRHPRKGNEVKVYHREKHLPLFSSYYWQSTGITDPKRNYQFFYPEVEWQGDQDCVNGPGFGIKRYAVPTDNGYLYFTDHVIDGLPTIYDILKSPSYSVYRKLADRFPNIVYDKDYTTKFATAGDTLYNYLHMDVNMARLQNLAFEWPVISQVLYNQHVADGITAFVPDDAAMGRFFDTFFQGYDSYDDLPDLTAYYLLQNHQIAPLLLFPETIEGEYVTAWGDPYRIKPDEEIGFRKICSNGLFYELNRVEEPLIFRRTATRSVFRSAEFEIFANVLFYSNKLYDLANPESPLSLLIPSDNYLTEAGFYVEHGSDMKLGDEKIFQKKTDGNGVETTTDMTAKSLNITNYHTIPQLCERSELASENGRWYATGKENSFLKIQRDTVYTERGEAFVIGAEEDHSSENNSRAFRMNGIMTPEETAFGPKMELVPFDQLCKNFREKVIKKSNPSFVDGSGRLKPFIGGKGIVFILRNDMVTPGSNGIPKEAEGVAMKMFAEHYMVSLSDNPQLKLVDLLNGEFTGKLKTLDTSYELEIGQQDGMLVVTPPVSGTGPIVAEGPYFTAETVFYIIDQVIPMP